MLAYINLVNIPNREANELCLSDGTGGISEEFDETGTWCVGAEGGRCVLELPLVEFVKSWLMPGLETGGVVL